MLTLSADPFAIVRRPSSRPPLFVGSYCTLTPSCDSQLTSLFLRSTKDMKSASGEPLVKLPELKFYVYKVALNPETRQLYDEIATQLKAIVEGFMKSGTAGKQYSHVRTLHSPQVRV